MIQRHTQEGLKLINDQIDLMPGKFIDRLQHQKTYLFLLLLHLLQNCQETHTALT